MTHFDGKLMAALLIAALPGVSFARDAAASAEAATTTAQATDSPIRPDDDKMSCPEILAEATARNREVDALMDERDATDAPASARTRTLQAGATALATVAGMIPVPPIASQAIASVGATAAMKSYNEDFQKAMAPVEKRMDFAMARMDHMHSLYQRKCLK